MAELSPEAAGMFQAAVSTARDVSGNASRGDGTPQAYADASIAIVLALHALALQLAENAEHTFSIDDGAEAIEP